MNNKIKILDNKRKKYIFLLVICFFILFIGFSILANFVKIDENYIILSFIGSITILISIFFLAFKLKELLEKELKKIIKEYIHSKFSFEYSPSNGLTKEEEIDVNIFQKNWDYMEVRDVINGFYENFSFKSAYINLISRFNKNSKEVFWCRVYVIFLPYDFFKLVIVPNLDGYKDKIILKKFVNAILKVAILILFFLFIQVIPNIGDFVSNLSSKIQNVFGNIGYFLKFPLIFFSIVICLLILLIIFFFFLYIFNLLDSNELTPKELIKMDINNENFNNYFKVYIDKEREIFNNEIIDKLIKIRERVGEFYIGLINNKLYILFPKENVFNNIFIKDISKVFENFIDDLERELLAVKEIVNIFGKIT